MISGKYSNSVMNLYFNGISFGKELNKLNPDVLGLGINFYLGLKKKNE